MYDVCHTSAACRKEYEIESDQSWLFSLFKLKNVGCWSAACSRRALRVTAYFPFYHVPSTTPYPFLGPIWTDTGWYCWYGNLQEAVTVSGHQYPSCILFATHHVRDKQRTVFLTSGEETKLSYSILFLVPYSARQVRGKERTVFLTSGEKSQVTAFSLSYSIRHASC